jgi:uncharacterized alpha-E superfamily protein
VLRDPKFPRACLYCLNEAEYFLRALPRSAGVLGSIQAARTFLEQASLETLDQPGLHEHIDRLQLHIIVVHEGIARTYFPPRAASATQSQAQLSSDARQKTSTVAQSPANSMQTS